MSMNYALIFREPTFDNYLNSPNGEVGRWLGRKGQKIETLAKMQVGKRTLKLRASIHRRQFRDRNGQTMLIGSPLPYALMHHTGTRPHQITPRRKQILRFVSKVRVVYSTRVMHPGTRPNRYLTDPLRRVIRFYGKI